MKDIKLLYRFSEGDRGFYTDVMLTVEATTKYILSRHHIDEILILGRQQTYDAGDDERVLGVEDGKSFYSADTDELSTYSLFRYRLSQFIDDLKIEQETINSLLTPAEQAEAEAFIKDFYGKCSEGLEHSRLSRFFDRLVRDAALYEQMKAELLEAVPAAAERRKRNRQRPEKQAQIPSSTDGWRRNRRSPGKWKPSWLSPDMQRQSPPKPEKGKPGWLNHWQKEEERRSEVLYESAF